MNWVKVVFYNLGITFALLGVLFLTPPTIEISSKYLKQLFSEILDKRANLSIYDKFEWSDRYFAEHEELGSTYHDYITWRRDDYAGENINIIDGVRHTSPPGAIQGVSAEAGLEYWFFGGSTTWGTGVNDENTYPSVFAKKMESRQKTSENLPISQGSLWHCCRTHTLRDQSRAGSPNV